VIANDSVANSSYLIIAPDIDLSKVDYEQLIKYIKAGNDVFIGAEYFGKLFGKKLSIETSNYFSLSGDHNPVNFVNPSLSRQKYFNVDKGIGDIFFSKFDTLKTAVLGENAQHKANFIKYSFGKGSLYLLANPKFFSNYSLLKPQGDEYAATALSYLKNTPKIIWDEYYTRGDEANDSPMRLFLGNEALSWAYYIALCSLLIFLLFEIKRRQRVIPVIAPLENSTVEFVNVVGQVYYEKRNNANIARKKILYLLEYLRDEYRIKTNKLDDEFVEALTAKLNIERALVTDLVRFIHNIDAQGYVSDHELIELNRLTEKFYKQTA
jgi:hypothetical protein